ncbi:MAG: hypothetical protein JKX78_14690 [Alteromonadaceae bacterium]|nr:hypothetical protein [Alteromonadaceae bacterium]
MNYSAVNKRERSLAELVIVISLLFILMASFIHYFFKNQPELNNVGFNNMANNFASQVVIIHSQWLMSGRPAQLTLTEIGGIQHKSQLTLKQKNGTKPASAIKVNNERIQLSKVQNFDVNGAVNQINNKRIIKLNKKGWITNYANKPLLPCQQVWQQVMNTEMILGKQPISALLIQQKKSLVENEYRKNRENSNINHKRNKSLVCRFIITTGQFFDYHSSNGRVNMSN